MRAVMLLGRRWKGSCSSQARRKEQTKRRTNQLHIRWCSCSLHSSFPPPSSESLVVGSMDGFCCPRRARIMSFTLNNHSLGALHCIEQARYERINSTKQQPQVSQSDAIKKNLLAGVLLDYHSRSTGSMPLPNKGESFTQLTNSIYIHFWLQPFSTAALLHSSRYMIFKSKSKYRPRTNCPNIVPHGTRPGIARSTTNPSDLVPKERESILLLNWNFWF